MFLPGLGCTSEGLAEEEAAKAGNQPLWSSEEMVGLEAMGATGAKSDPAGSPDTFEFKA